MKIKTLEIKKSDINPINPSDLIPVINGNKESNTNIHKAILTMDVRDNVKLEVYKYLSDENGNILYDKESDGPITEVFEYNIKDIDLKLKMLG